MLLLKCPEGGCQKTFLACIYCCKEGIKKKCLEWDKKFDEVKAQVIDDKYLEKYGEPTYTIPLSRRKRRKRKNPVEKKEKQVIKMEEEE